MKAKQCGKEKSTIVVVDPEIFIPDQDRAFQIIPGGSQSFNKNFLVKDIGLLLI
jgi:hypothetical protein